MQNSRKLHSHFTHISVCCLVLDYYVAQFCVSKSPLYVVKLWKFHAYSLTNSWFEIKHSIIFHIQFLGCSDGIICTKVVGIYMCQTVEISVARHSNQIGTVIIMHIYIYVPQYFAFIHSSFRITKAHTHRLMNKLCSKKTICE